MRQYLHADDTLFRNSNAFELDYTPEIFNHREPQLRDIAFALRPGIRGNRPVSLILRGLPGTGKTTAVRRIFSEIEETSRQLVPVYVNCQSEKSRYAVFGKIFTKIFGIPPPPNGKPIRQLVHEIGKRMSERKLVVVVCLDDANYLLPENVLNNVLYVLLRLYEEYPGARAGVLLPMSCMDIDLRQVLDSCVISVLQPDEVYFPPYSGDEIREILSDRIKAGLCPDTIPAPVFDLVVSHTLRSGDIRVGLDLVKRSVMAAERAGRTVVEPGDVESSFEFSKLFHLSSSVRALGGEERRLLGHIAGMALSSDRCVTTAAVYESASTYMPQSYSAFFEKLRRLDDMRLIELSYLHGRGRRKEIALRYDAGKVAEECGE
jgi:archaeal cell division control protein 6